MTDILIAGGGPAGLTAALYALRSGNKVTLVEQGAPGGQLLKTEKIDNYPGFAQGVLGMELAMSMFQQVSNFPNFTLEMGTVLDVKKKGNAFSVTLSGDKTLEAKSVVLAMGGNPRYLEIPGETELTGKGVSYCAICDGFFFKDKVVTVVGGGNTAVEDALYLAKVAKEVHLIHRRDTFRASKTLTDELAHHENIHCHLNKIPVTVKGETKVETIVIEDTQTKTENL